MALPRTKSTATVATPRPSRARPRAAERTSARSSSAGGDHLPQSSRRRWVTAGIVALVLVVIGVGIGIWRYQDSGSSSKPSAAANEAPNPGPRPGDQTISIDQTWTVPAGTHVTITWPGGGH